jgi:hypothetical protein
MIGQQAVYAFLFLQKVGYTDRLARTGTLLNSVLQDRQWWREMQFIHRGGGVPGGWQDETWEQLFRIWSGVKICVDPAEVV